MPAPHTATHAQARALMDRALMGPRGVKVTFPDADFGSPDAARKIARNYQIACNSAKKSQREAQRASAIAEGTDPDAVTRTPYDALSTTIDRTPADDGWSLTIQAVTLEGLLVEDL